MPFNNSFEVAAQMIAMRPKMSNAVLSTLVVVEPSLLLVRPDRAPCRDDRADRSAGAGDGRPAQTSRRRGIGDNNPPEPIEPSPLSAKQLDEIRKATAVLKKQPPAPIPPSSKAKAAVALLMKFRAYLAKHADNLVTEAAKEAGKRIV
jgi:hypothetical protein